MIREKTTDPFLHCQPEKTFIEELKTPVHSEKPPYFGIRTAEENEVMVSGMYLCDSFEDVLLETAYADFKTFMEVFEIGGNRYPIIVRKGETSVFEEYKIITSDEKTILLAADTEGIRRGLVYLEDEMRRREGPFLPKGEFTRTPHIRARISHCFFAPINRPPNNGEELGDEVDYYPEQYLNRLAHDGTNGVWIYTKFNDLLPSKIIPEYGKDSKRRLDKLNRTIEKCKRYGIRVYAFAIEPAALRGELLKKYSDIAGALSYDGPAFCTSSERGKAYCKEAFETLFTACPNLAGAIICTNGERTTNCSSAYDAIKQHVNTCPNCRDKNAGEILAQAVDAMREGMRAANPGAEFLSWTYGHRGWEYEDIEDYVRLLPEDAGMIQGFEDNGLAEQLGKDRMAIDYWLSYVGPSEMFQRTAKASSKYGKTLFAKTQVCCSHELATVPYLPVPGIMFDKFEKMHELGVQGLIQCWYFGNYPSLMNKAAGELAFLHDFTDKKAFLLNLAAIYWGKTKAEAIARVFEHFEAGYKNFPVNIMFSYYGPMHDGPVWLLQLLPKNFALPRSWQYGDPMDGDRIYEALLCGHSLTEAVTLAKNMHESWQKGMEILQSLPKETDSETEQHSVASALSCLFESGMHILEFYLLRDRLGKQEGDLTQILSQMEAIVRAEIKISRRLAEISGLDGRLGFHSEAEGFKYFPEKLEARAKYLENLLETEFAVVRQRIEKGILPLEYYGGIEPGVPRYTLGSGWSDFSEGGAQVRLWEDAESIIIEFRSKKQEGITISPEFHLFRFNTPVCINTDGTPFIRWLVWLYFSLQAKERAEELEKYTVKLLPPSADYPGSHYEIRLNKEKFRYTGDAMKMAIHTNIDEFHPGTYWRKPKDSTVYLGKYDIHPDMFVWIDRK